MTFRELIGFTPNMGVFEIAETWTDVPAAIKSKLPPAVVQSIDALAIAVTAYSALIAVYGIAKQVMDTVNQAQISASLPPNPAPAAGVVAKEAAKMAIQQAVGGLMNSAALIQLALNQNVPLL